MHRIPCGAFALLLSVAPVSAATCLASYYGRESGRFTANGERFDPHGKTCAHRALPFGTMVRVTDLATGLSVDCRITDRGPFVRGRCIDLSYGRAAALHILQRGTARVKIERLR